MFFRINVFYFLTLLLLQGHQSKARGPVCLQCDQVSQPSDCRNIKRCGDQELCSMRKYVTNNGHMWFDVGCSSSQRCSPITSILGKREDDDGLLPISLSKLRQNGRHNIKSNYVRSAGDTIVCENCCSGDICNAGSLCGTVGFLHEMVCFKCTSTNEDGCSTIALCDQNEKCFIEKVGNSSTSNSVWKTGCRHNDKCQHIQSSPGTECLSSCCTSDLCNMKCSNNNTDASCVDKSQTCTNTTFQSFVCSTKELQAVCPRSCGLCHCTHNPCTHGTCTSSQQGYKCTCDAGYTGSICDRVIDHCSPNPCVHGICNNSLQGYNCSCFSGYEGSTCTELNPCEPNPCKHGSCHKGPNGYDCTCFIEYTGSTCETALPLWRWKDCSNPATRSISISYLDISPKPIRIPGNITSAYDIRINQRIGRYENSPLQLNVTLDKALLGHWHAVPCNNKIGTCIYDDLCEIIRRTFFTRTCPQAIIDAGYTCGCPIRIDPAHLVMNYHPQREVSSLWQPLSDFGLFGNGIESIIEVVLQLFSGISDVKKISSQYSFLTTGTFRGRFELLERNQMIGCLAVEFSMKTPCYGFLCGG